MTNLTQDDDTIAAIATPSGRGGVGIVRVSGSLVPAIATAVLRQLPTPRYATFATFYDEHNAPLDKGLALYFPKPHSFTGEEVLELHGHGGPVVLDCLLRRVLALNVRLARPGEFSQRAFLNNKIDLAQAEAIADLIDAASEQAARAAMRSLQGEFSQAIHALVDAITHLRIYVEAAIDFPDEEIDFYSDGKIAANLVAILAKLDQVYATAQQGTLLREGLTLVIAGQPNAGKSTLLNRLSGRDAAIVTAIPGTTRDILREHIHLDGLPLHILDTAGLRDTPDPVEQEGIRRAWQAIASADRVLLVVDSCQQENNSLTDWAVFKQKLPRKVGLTVIRNKSDLAQKQISWQEQADFTVITLSAQTGEGLPLLREHLKKSLGYAHQGESGFSARRRHLAALNQAQAALLRGQQVFQEHQAFELLAEELYAAQVALGEITGMVTADALLGQIFASFCLGK